MLSARGGLGMLEAGRTFTFAESLAVRQTRAWISTPHRLVWTLPNRPHEHIHNNKHRELAISALAETGNGNRGLLHWDKETPRRLLLPLLLLHTLTADCN